MPRDPQDEPEPTTFTGVTVNSLDGRVIAIAGAGGGLGPSVVKRLGDEGAILALADVKLESAEAAAAEAGLPDDRIDARATDLLDERDTVAWVEHLTGRFGRIDGLAHLVGGWRGGDPIESFDLSDYEFLHDLLVRSLQISTRAFHGPLTASEHGRFLLVSSSQAQRPGSTNAAYAAAKAAAESWTLALADSFDGTPATANIIVVNAILTPAMAAEDPGGDHAGLTPAEDIADAIAFACSDAGARMNGQRISLHG